MDTDRVERPASSSSGRGWFVAGLLIAAVSMLAAAPIALPASYSWTMLGLSEAAAQGVEGAWVARTGFLLFGLAVMLLAELSSGVRAPAIWIPHAAFGISMIGVATFAHAPWETGAPFVVFEDTLHSWFASAVGISFILGVTSTLVIERHRPPTTAMGDVGALLVALIVPLTMSSTMWGVFQRVMFLTAAIWFATRARPMASVPPRPLGTK